MNVDLEKQFKTMTESYNWSNDANRLEELQSKGMELFIIKDDFYNLGTITLFNPISQNDVLYEIKMKRLRIDGESFEKLQSDLDRFGICFIDPKPISEFVKSRVDTIYKFGFKLDEDMYYVHPTYNCIASIQIQTESNAWFRNTIKKFNGN
jgi:hypothetical protein